MILTGQSLVGLGGITQHALGQLSEPVKKKVLELTDQIANVSEDTIRAAAHMVEEVAKITASLQIPFLDRLIDNLKSVSCESTNIGTVGEALYPTAFSEALRRSPAGEPLTKFQGDVLAPFFDTEMLDQVQVHYSAYIPNTFKFRLEVGALYNEEISLRTGNPGITFANHVFIQFSRSETLGFKGQGVDLVGHEVQRVKQWWQRNKSIGLFAHDYFIQYCKAGFDYYSIQMEKDAFKFGT